MRITHETIYRYKSVVRFAPHRLVLRPREGHDVRVEEMVLRITPEHELNWSRDVFGNNIATVHFSEPADELCIHSHILLRQTMPFPLRSARPSTPPPYPPQFTAIEETVASAYRAPVYPDDLASVKEWVDHLDLTSCDDAESVVALANLQIRQDITYNRRETKGVQTPYETLSSRTGSCRDFATLFLEVLRLLGFPARFVSGYLDCRASEAGWASTHAWAEAYLPEIGWVGYDPTIGERTNSRHVVVGVSNHPRGVMPVSGSYFGEQGQFLGMHVAVKTERLNEAPVAGKA